MFRWSGTPDVYRNEDGGYTSFRVLELGLMRIFHLRIYAPNGLLCSEEWIVNFPLIHPVPTFFPPDYRIVPIHDVQRLYR